MTPDSSPDRPIRPSLRGRASAMLAALLVNLLLLSALLMMNVPVDQRPKFKGRPVLVDLIPDERAESDSTEAAQEQAPAEAASEPAPAEAAREPAPTPARPAPVEPPPVPDTRPLPFLVLTEAEMAASDIGKVAPSGPATPAGSGAGAQRASRDSERIGTAPNGEPLYRAEWHRRPTSAELAAYLPDRMPTEGWGLIACRTAPRFKVEDCVEIADSPPGSRLAGAVRQAAWQFLVRPPRIGGKPLVGSWVSIRIEYSPSAAE